MAHRSERWLSKGYLWTEIRPSTAIQARRISRLRAESADSDADPREVSVIGWTPRPHSHPDEAPPTKAVHRGGPDVACFRRDAGGHQAVSDGCRIRYSSRLHLSNPCS